jgi:hypothetical protein
MKRSVNGNDPRVQRTRQLLLQTFMALVQENLSSLLLDWRSRSNSPKALKVRYCLQNNIYR